MDELLTSLRTTYPDLSFTLGDSFFWSPKDNVISYRVESMRPDFGNWSQLHEVGHAELGHRSYGSDFELVKLEVEAWQRAKLIARKHGITIDPEHIQDCLDTYRDWLHRRSTCPACGTVSLQKDPNHYQCFNCHCIWRVSTSRFCRPYRKTARI